MVTIRDIPDARPIGEQDLPPVVCVCGWKGSGKELLFSENENDTLPERLQLPMYCPQCHRNGWEGWEWA